MLVKSFVLRKDSFQAIVNQCVPGTIAIVRPEKLLEHLFRSYIHKKIVEKDAAADELNAIKSYLDSLTDNFQYLQKKEEFLAYVQDYVEKAIVYVVPIDSVEDYILAQCANLCAQVVACEVNEEALDGRDLVVCNLQKETPVFDWAATNKEIERKCKGKSFLIVSGGYARSSQGVVVGIGKGGANLLSSLIASAIKAESVEYFVEGEGINGITSMTYDEAAHYCASNKAPFPSAVLWPVKQAGIPIIVKGIQHPDFAGTRISSVSGEPGKEVSGIVVDQDVHLVTVYGTGLLGCIGASSEIFSSLAKAGVNVRFIAQTSSEYSISFAVGVKESTKVSEVIKAMIIDNPLIPTDDLLFVNREVAIVTVYGSQMRNIPGVSGRLYSLLGEAHVNVIASAQGGEELSISVVLDVADLDKAQKALECLLN